MVKKEEERNYSRKDTEHEAGELIGTIAIGVMIGVFLVYSIVLVVKYMLNFIL